MSCEIVKSIDFKKTTTNQNINKVYINNCTGYKWSFKLHVLFVDIYKLDYRTVIPLSGKKIIILRTFRVFNCFKTWDFKYLISNSWIILRILYKRRVLLRLLWKDWKFINFASFIYVFLLVFIVDLSWVNEKNTEIHFMCGINAGLMASLVTHPFDVVKTQMQLYPHRYRSTGHCIAVIFTQQGYKGFLRGLTPRCVRRTLISALSWTVFEEIMKRMELKIWM